MDLTDYQKQIVARILKDSSVGPWILVGVQLYAGGAARALADLRNGVNEVEILTQWSESIAELMVVLMKGDQEALARLYLQALQNGADSAVALSDDEIKGIIGLLKFEAERNKRQEKG
jgi:hypothetical protein